PFSPFLLFCISPFFGQPVDCNVFAEKILLLLQFLSPCAALPGQPFFLLPPTGPLPRAIHNNKKSLKQNHDNHIDC
ncbi:hypothetical protein, partial [Alcanivorax sp. MD8A]|uniref:hypothetical protein n=1 Tax=Alcanivorax sp. MD8A TaxID=1177157 RepID=UPI001E33EBAB